MTQVPLLMTCAIGLGLGLRHALESDHLAAITTMVSNGHGPREAAMVGASWGGGHAAALLVLGAILIALGVSMPAPLAATFDLAVVAMLAILGIYAIFGSKRAATEATPHAHSHPHSHARLSWRAALIGLVHGASGTAAIALLWLTRLETNAHKISFLIVFALGATASMTLLSAVLAVPLAAAMKRWRRSALVLRVSSGALSIAAAVAVLAAVLAPT